MKKIFLLLVLINLIAIPKQGWGGYLNDCHRYATYTSNSRSYISGWTSLYMTYDLDSSLSQTCSCTNLYQKTEYSEYKQTVGTSEQYKWACGDVNCSSFSSGICKSCSMGYTLETYGCCLNLFGYTSGGGGLCNIDSSHACSATNCGAGYYRKSYASSCSCSTCPSNASCTGDGVFTCNTGYYKTSTTATTCTSCPASDTYTTCSGTTLTCASGYALSGTSCVVSSTTCENGTYKTTDSGSCTTCPDNATCSGGTEIYDFTCDSGYYKTSDTATECTSCGASGTYTTCSGTSLTCANTAYKSSNVCYACPTGCSACSSSSSCSSCSSGYFLYGSTCTACPTPTSSYTTCSGSTLTCASAYTKSGSTCEYTGTIASCPTGLTKSSCLDCCQR